MHSEAVTDLWLSCDSRMGVFPVFMWRWISARIVVRVSIEIIKPVLTSGIEWSGKLPQMRHTLICGHGDSARAKISCNWDGLPNLASNLTRFSLFLTTSKKGPKVSSTIWKDVLQQYFLVVLFVFSIFCKLNCHFFFTFEVRRSLRVKSRRASLECCSIYKRMIGNYYGNVPILT